DDFTGNFIIRKTSNCSTVLPSSSSSVVRASPPTLPIWRGSAYQCLSPPTSRVLPTCVSSPTHKHEQLLFFSYFKELVGKVVTVELKNDLAITGILHSVDQYLNIKLEDTRVVDEAKYPHMLSVKNCFIRGSVVRYVQLPPDGVDVDILHDATRREARGA
ncbi:unnamed protein product, partial [Sphagnum jensenii]